MIEKLYKVLNQFTKPSYRIENKIHGKISDFIEKELEDQQPPLDSPIYYEKTAFSFMENGNRPEALGEIFYSPLYGNIDPVTK